MSEKKDENQGLSLGGKIAMTAMSLALGGPILGPIGIWIAWSSGKKDK